MLNAVTAFRDLVADAQDLGTELQEAFDLTEQTRNGLKTSKTAWRGCLRTSRVWLWIISLILLPIRRRLPRMRLPRFVDEVRGELELLQSDITRLTRFDEDQGTRRERLEEDRDRRLAQLQRQRRTIAARGGGDQQSIERAAQRQQDLSFRISEARENFGVRLSRFDEDTETRRGRTIEDATLRRERFERKATVASRCCRSWGTALLGVISSAISSALASGLAGLLAGALGEALSNPCWKVSRGYLGEVETATETQAAQQPLTARSLSPKRTSHSLKGLSTSQGRLPLLSLTSLRLLKPLISPGMTCARIKRYHRTNRVCGSQGKNWHN